MLTLLPILYLGNLAIAIREVVTFTTKYDKKERQEQDNTVEVDQLAGPSDF